MILIREQKRKNKSTIFVVNFNTPLSVVGRTNRPPKISKDIEVLNNINQLDLVVREAYKTCHPERAEKTLF